MPKAHLGLTLATRFGSTVNFSEDYEFFQAATLGGLANLRGFGCTRFAGGKVPTTTPKCACKWRAFAAT
jgi:hypothetical protein